LAELREMARGIHPAILTQEGLEAAVGFVAKRAPLPVRIDVRLQRRLPQDVEATAYFVVSEALTNAAKHSGASSIAVAGRLRDGRLRIEVTDDGRGGADGRLGSGLQSLVDRLATLEGQLTVDSPAGGGTRLRAEISCGDACRRRGAVPGGNGSRPERGRLRRDRPGRKRRGVARPRPPRSSRRRDHRHPHASGPDRRRHQAAVEIRQISPDVGLLLLSQHVETHHAMRTDNRVSEKAWATCSRTESPTWRPSPATFDASPTVTA
jgi:hypothetical protein